MHQYDQGDSKGQIPFISMEGLPIDHDDTQVARNVLNKLEKFPGYLVALSNAKIWSKLDRTLVPILVPEGNQLNTLSTVHSRKLQRQEIIF